MLRSLLALLLFSVPLEAGIGHIVGPAADVLEPIPSEWRTDAFTEFWLDGKRVTPREFIRAEVDEVTCERAGRRILRIVAVSKVLEG